MNIQLDERTMSKREHRIPQLAESAVRKARTRTLTSGRNVVEAIDGKLIESHPDGSFRVIRSLAAPIPVAPGQKRIRRSK